MPRRAHLVGSCDTFRLVPSHVEGATLSTLFLAAEERQGEGDLLAIQRPTFVQVSNEE